MALTGARASLNLRTIIRVAIAFVILVWAPGMLGQSKFRNLTGTVTDRHHETLRGAVVQVHNDATNSVISFITSRSGRYSFKRLDVDNDYRIWATFNGHQSKTKKLSEFDSHQSKVINLVIELP